MSELKHFTPVRQSRVSDMNALRRLRISIHISGMWAENTPIMPLDEAPNREAPEPLRAAVDQPPIEPTRDVHLYDLVRRAFVPSAERGACESLPRGHDVVSARWRGSNARRSRR
ncbi:hypothetical protein AURDEDRAFT_163519 [Auricularia subglabra TFB-10046 SS5]|uniref:Uncharacterized protein n=1 Tax=Auricularia subglabra (strain TFB-10046 / SS5) TaxID=717982 RepID=J0CQB6_AURST|nr:hypothetical protein AURDEDRAFT_178533 [Auricularia subglabra TFB-10046 SS5]EJD47306.1 hypothetical protein AURDEDRAFT_163519 [Auricularia subglabra TFB-10046 SS5]